MNYSELVNAARQYADRNDIEVSNNFPTFFLMVESKINRVLATREQSARAYTRTVTDQEYYALPVDYSGMRDIQLNTALPTEAHSRKPMNYLTPELMNVYQELDLSKIYYTIIANQIQIYPTQESGYTIEIIYFQNVPPLTESNTTNWLSDSHPDIYISGLIAEVEMFAKNYDAGKLWYNRMTQAINELDSADSGEVWAGSPLTIKLG